MVCFIVNNDVTVLYQHISKHLAMPIFWISPSDYWVKFLLSMGVDRNNVLDLTKNDYRKLNHEEISGLHEFEYLSLTQILIADRHLRTKPLKNQIAYVKYATDEIYEFLKRNDVKYVIGESTTAIEMISANIIKELNGHFIRLMTARIPSNRTLLFADLFERYIIDLASPFEPEQIAQVLEKNVKGAKKPAYFYSNNARPKVRLDRLRSYWVQLFNNVELRNPTYPTLTRRLLIVMKRQVLWRFNKLLCATGSFFEPADRVLDKKYVLMTLHKQPESTIDVLGYPYANQVGTIERVAALLPENYSLVVKEHSNALEDRGLRYYNRIKKIPKVLLVDPNSDSRKLINGSELVISICGTSSLEAKLLGKKSATLVPLYFNKLLSIPVLGLHTYESKQILKEILESPDDNMTDLEVSRYLDGIFGLSADFTLGSITKSPEVLSKGNIVNAANALNKAISMNENTGWNLV